MIEAQKPQSQLSTFTVSRLSSLSMLNITYEIIHNTSTPQIIFFAY